MGFEDEPITLHKYLYVNADPINLVDPSGNLGIGDVLAVLSARSTLFVFSGGASFSAGFIARDFNTTGEFHEYDVENRICSAPSRGVNNCTLENVFEGLRHFPAPGYDGVLAVENNQEKTLPFFGPVHHSVSANSVINTTLEGHLLFPGFVERAVEQRGDAIFVTTHGEGTGRLPLLNIWFSDPLWSSVDRNIRNFVK